MVCSLSLVLSCPAAVILPVLLSPRRRAAGAHFDMLERKFLAGGPAASLAVESRRNGPDAMVCERRAPGSLTAGRSSARPFVDEYDLLRGKERRAFELDEALLVFEEVLKAARAPARRVAEDRHQVVPVE